MVAEPHGSRPSTNEKHDVTAIGRVSMYLRVKVRVRVRVRVKVKVRVGVSVRVKVKG